MKLLFAVMVVLVAVPVFTYSQDNIRISTQGGMTMPIGNFGDLYQRGHSGTGFLFRVSGNFFVNMGVKYNSIQDGETDALLSDFIRFIPDFLIAFK